MKEKYKIIFTEHFKERLSSLSAKDKKKVLKIINKIKKNPYKGKKIKNTALRYMELEEK